MVYESYLDKQCYVLYENLLLLETYSYDEDITDYLQSFKRLLEKKLKYDIRCPGDILNQELKEVITFSLPNYDYEEKED